MVGASRHWPSPRWWACVARLNLAAAKLARARILKLFEANGGSA